jgi:hypothetical protein
MTIDELLYDIDFSTRQQRERVSVNGPGVVHSRDVNDFFIGIRAVIHAIRMEKSLHRVIPQIDPNLEYRMHQLT